MLHIVSHRIVNFFVYRFVYGDEKGGLQFHSFRLISSLTLFIVTFWTTDVILVGRLLVNIFLDLEFDIYFFIFRYTVFHGASKMLQELQSSGGMKDLTFVVVFV